MPYGFLFPPLNLLRSKCGLLSFPVSLLSLSCLAGGFCRCCCCRLWELGGEDWTGSLVWLSWAFETCSFFVENKTREGKGKGEVAWGVWGALISRGVA